MIDLKDVEHVCLHPGKTNFRLGIYGLRKIAEAEERTCRLCQNKFFKGGARYYGFPLDRKVLKTKETFKDYRGATAIDGCLGYD